MASSMGGIYVTSGCDYNLSTRSLIHWLSDCVDMPLEGVKDLKDGVVYLKFLARLFHDKQIMKKCILHPQSPQHSLFNLKLVQETLFARDLSFIYSIDEIARGSVKTNIEAIKWLIKLVEMMNTRGENQRTDRTDTVEEDNKGSTHSTARRSDAPNVA